MKARILLRRWRLAIVLIGSAASSCTTVGGLMPGSGPSASATLHAAAPGSEVQVVELTPDTAKQVIAQARPSQLRDLPAPEVIDDRVAHGDQLEIALWEAAPAMLFGALSDSSSGPVGRTLTLPVQTVNFDGTISVPFAGRLQVTGRSTAEIEALILARLEGKAHEPQVLVRSVKPAQREITVIGDVVQSTRQPITPKGERVLDVVAAAGGSKGPPEKATVQVSRRGVNLSVPLERIIEDPRENVLLAPGDVITVFSQPKSFMAMGAVSKVGEVSFEATGLTLAQALVRAGGPIDARSDAAGVFIFRIAGGRPTIYRLDLRSPVSMFVLRDFPVEDRDILYVANAPGAELQKFLNLVSSVAYPLDVARNLSR